MSHADVEETSMSPESAACKPLVDVVQQLAALCRVRRLDNGDALDRVCERLLRLVRGRADASHLLAGCDVTTASAEFISVLRCAVEGHAMTPGATRSQRHVHKRLLVAYGPPAARARVGLAMDHLERRYPRLLRAMRDAAILSQGEAQSALYMLLQAHPTVRRSCCASCEAVAHFGGNLAVVRAAIRRRRLFPSTRMRQNAT
jgi:hypothetical protein